jgi:D-sedoheptulose 7-phosphate isomerase
MLEQRIQQQFFDSADLMVRAADALSRPLADAVQAVLGAITGGGKLLVCGSGGSAALGHQFVAQLVGRFERERPGLPAIALGAEATLVAAGTPLPGDRYARALQALGQPGDVLLLLCDEPPGDPLLAALDAAHGQDMTVIALTPAAAPGLAERLSETDVRLAVPHERPARVRELQSVVLNCLCDGVDLQLLGEQDPS